MWGNKLSEAQVDNIRQFQELHHTILQKKEPLQLKNKNDLNCDEIEISKTKV
jgi:hypothetical protein